MILNKKTKKSLNILILMILVLSQFGMSGTKVAQAESVNMPLLSTITFSNNINTDIEDAPSWTTPGPPAYQCIDFSGSAPTNAIVDSIDISFNIDHDYISDLIAWVGHESWNSYDDHGYLVIDREGQTGDDLFDGYNDTIDKTINNYSPPSGSYFYDGRSVVNQVWCLVVQDKAPGDDGRIDELSITLDYHIAYPDIDVYSDSISSDDVYAGDTIVHNFSMRNDGDLDAGSFTTKIILAEGTNYSSINDRILKTITTSGLDAGYDSIQSNVVTIPADVSPGDWYIKVFADYYDTVDESDEGNNYRNEAITVREPKPDLRVSYVSFTPDPIERGRSGTLFYTIQNIGVEDSIIFENGLYLSTDTNITQSDTPLGTRAMNPLADGSSRSDSLSVQIPISTSPGHYYIGVITDIDDLNDELDEGNNTGLTPIDVTFREYDVQVGKTGSGSGTIQSSPSGIDCGGTCTTSFTEGTYITLTADPDTGSRIVAWHGGTGTCSGSGTTCSFTLNNLVQTYVDFGFLEYTLSVSTTGSGSGNVTSIPAGINCPGVCSENYVYNTSVILDAAADPGSDFTGWNLPSCPGTGGCTVSMTQAQSVTAYFVDEPDPCYKLTRNSAPVGSPPTATPTNSIGCSFDYFHAEEPISMTEHPASGWVLDHWTGTTCSSCDYLNMPAGPRTVTAYYELPPSTDTIGFWNPTKSKWYLKNNNSGGDADNVFKFGPVGLGWEPITGDWNDNGVDTIGYYNPNKSKWYLKNSNSAGEADIVFVFGPVGVGWEPITGDWDGNGSDTVGFYNPNKSKWVLKNSNSSGEADLEFYFGPVGVGWEPIVGDWDGDGNDTIGFYNPNKSKWYLKNSNSKGDADIVFAFGPVGVGWEPITGNWDVDSDDTIGFYNPSKSKWYLKNSNSSGDPNVVFVFGPVGVGWEKLTGNW